MNARGCVLFPLYVFMAYYLSTGAALFNVFVYLLDSTLEFVVVGYGVQSFPCSSEGNFSFQYVSLY